MSEETILTAAKRVIRSIRADTEMHGSLLSLDTIKAAELLDVEVRKEAKRQDGATDEPAMERNGGSPPALSN